LSSALDGAVLTRALFSLLKPSMQADLVASADARAAVGLLRKAQEDASATEHNMRGELDRCHSDLAAACAAREEAANRVSALEQYAAASHTCPALKRGCCSLFVCFPKTQSLLGSVESTVLAWCRQGLVFMSPGYLISLFASCVIINLRAFNNVSSSLYVFATTPQADDMALQQHAGTPNTMHALQTRRTTCCSCLELA
jgi:hypothetical protein